MKIRRVPAALLDNRARARRPERKRPGRRRTDIEYADRARTERIVRDFVRAHLGGRMDDARRLADPALRFHSANAEGRVVDLVGFDALVAWGRVRRAAVGAAVSLKLLETLAGAEHAALLFEERWASPRESVHHYMVLFSVENGLVSSLRVYGMGADPLAGGTFGAPQ